MRSARDKAEEAHVVAVALMLDAHRFRDNGGAGMIAEAQVQATLAVAAHLGRIADVLEADRSAGAPGLRRGGVED